MHLVTRCAGRPRAPVEAVCAPRAQHHQQAPRRGAARRRPRPAARHTGGVPQMHAPMHCMQPCNACTHACMHACIVNISCMQTPCGSCMIACACCAPCGSVRLQPPLAAPSPRLKSLTATPCPPASFPGVPVCQVQGPGGAGLPADGRPGHRLGAGACGQEGRSLCWHQWHAMMYN